LGINFSLSTLWSRGRFESLHDFFSTAQTTGFDQFELDASLSLKTIANVSLPEGQVPSIEVPCPAHPKNFDAKFSSLDRYERDAAREAALSSFELAYDLKAQALIINLGRTDINPKLEEALYDAWRSGGAESDTYQDLRQELVETRAKNAGPHLKAALHDVEYLANKAVEFGLKLGLVTPSAYSGFPLPEEMHILLEEFGDPVYYWHDAGQAQIFDTLNLLSSQVWLDMFAEQMIGLHLHNTKGLRKWMPTQDKGDITLADLQGKFSSDVLWTCKFASTYEPDVISKELDFFKTTFDSTS